MPNFDQVAFTPGNNNDGLAWHPLFDLRNCWSSLLGSVHKLITESRWSPAALDYAGAKGIEPEQVSAAAHAALSMYVSAVQLFVADMPAKEFGERLVEVGFYDVPLPGQVLFMTAMGQAFTGYCVRAMMHAPVGAEGNPHSFHRELAALEPLAHAAAETVHMVDGDDSGGRLMVILATVRRYGPVSIVVDSYNGDNSVRITPDGWSLRDVSSADDAKVVSLGASHKELHGGSLVVDL